MVTLHNQANDLADQLKLFRATHTPRRLTVADIEWTYLTGGRGNHSLLLLPGVHGRGEIAFQHMLCFEQGYRVIAPDYPAEATTIALLVEGLLEIMREQQIKVCAIVGGSFSGMVAQCLLRHAPGRVNRLILDHTGPPSKRMVMRHHIYYTILATLPEPCIHALFRSGNRLSLPGLPAQETFWRTYFAGFLMTLNKADYVSRARVALDFHQHYRFEHNDLPDWPGRMLIIEADNDAFQPRRERAALKALYPHARVYTFHGTGHSAWASEFTTFHKVMAQFLQEEE